MAPASPFDRGMFDRGADELRRLGFEPVFNDAVFDRAGFVAGTPEARARDLNGWWGRQDVDAMLAVRGGYGSVEVLPFLDVDRIRASRTALVGYSDITSLHIVMGGLAGMTSVHGPMIDGRLGVGPASYDPATFLASLTVEPLGEMAPDGLEALRMGEAAGPLVGGTLTQILASLATPYRFRPPSGHVLFIDEVGERPYRIHRMLTQMRLSGLLALSVAIVFGQLPRCDEPGGQITARQVVSECLADFPGPVLFGFPSGHSTSPLVTLPLGVRARVVTSPRPALVLDEAAAL